MKDLIKRLNADDYSSLNDDIEDLAAKKITERIKAKKPDILKELNARKERQK